MLCPREQPLVDKYMDITNNWYHYLHTQRKLSAQVIKYAMLDIHNDLLVIPIFDISGKKIFSKYRRAPWHLDTDPKYRYDVGAKISLYGIDHIGAQVIVTEGELDVLALATCGFNACTSTGGALSFQSEWSELFKNAVVTILYDNDETGIKGAVKTALILKKFTYRWIPERYGKDISDVLQNYGEDTVKELMHRIDNCVAFDIPPLDTKKSIILYRRHLKTELRKLTSGCVGAYFIRGLIVELSTMLVDMSKPKKSHADYSVSDDVARARTYPITSIINVRRGVALCPAHEEKTPSLHVYNDNHAFCFGACRRRFDAIDIAMKHYGIDFKEAVKRLSQ